MTESSITSTTSFLTVKSGLIVVDYYIVVFGATKISGYVRSDNKITSKISIKGATCWVGDEEQQFENVSLDLLSNSPVRIISQKRINRHLLRQ